jgi:hypothetical protein
MCLFEPAVMLHSPEFLPAVPFFFASILLESGPRLLLANGVAALMAAGHVLPVGLLTVSAVSLHGRFHKSVIWAAALMTAGVSGGSSLLFVALAKASSA